VTAAKQRQQQLYGRFIELALQGQQAAAIGGHLGLQQLMELVRECVKEKLRHGSSGSSSSGGIGGGQEGGQTHGGTRLVGGDTNSASSSTTLDVMALIKRVQLRHQEMLMQQQQPQLGSACLRFATAGVCARGTGPFVASKQQPGTSAAATATVDSKGTAFVAQQRLFVAFLNVAHQNNLAAAAAGIEAGGAAAGARVDAAGDVGQGASALGSVSQGRGSKRSHAGDEAACEHGAGDGEQQQQQGAAALAPGTKIFLA
jgi:hypothetical protein